MQNNIEMNTALAKELYKRNFELLQQRKRAEQLLHSVSEAVITINPQFEITLFNSVAENMLKIDAASAMNKHIDEVITLRTEKGQQLNAKDYCFQKESDKSSVNGAILTANNKNYYVNIKAATLTPTEDFIECLITITDITKERNLDDLKDEFLSVASHELRTPMTIIKSYLWMLLQEKGGPLTDKQKTYINKAMNGSERLIALVNDMLNVAQIEQGRTSVTIEKVDIGKFVDNTLTAFRIKADEKNIYLNIEKEKNVKYAYADSARLEEIITNLVGNAIKFTKQGGITIKIEPENGKFVKVLIIDTGKGIDKEDITRLFHKFGRLDNSYRTVAEAGGTGLGLYITKSLVELMGGKIGAFSEGPEKGSTFWFTLPVDVK